MLTITIASHGVVHDILQCHILGQRYLDVVLRRELRRVHAGIATVHELVYGYLP